MSALLPVALLLLWSAIAATAFTGLVAAPLLGLGFASLALSPRHPVNARALGLGIVLYPLCYSLGFNLVHQASLASGALLGLIHAAGFGALALRQGGRQLLRASLRRLLLFVIYGAVLGFAFVLP